MQHATRSPPPAPQTIPEALARYEDSDAVALICGDETLTYRELLADARHVARALVERGVQKGDRVVLDMRRSAGYIRVCLGIILAGGVKVALHGGWPERQRAMVIADCAPVLVVDDATARELCLTPLHDANASLPELLGGDPFRIVYTSGSTGAPKGVVNGHSLPVDNLTVREGSTGKSPLLRDFVDNCERMLLDANLAFAVMDSQLYTAILNGKTVVLATDEELATPKALAACIRRTGADTMYGVFSRYYRYLDDADFAAAVAGMKLIILTGERAEAKVVEAVRAASDAMLYANYGAAEAFTALAWRYQKDDEILYEETTNGGPVYLLERDSLDDAPVGTDGELCVGGPAGQYGHYWNAPEINAKKYVEHPLYGRLFRSGDGARREPDGRLRILGRLDGMAKLRGQRVELGAIEAAMEAIPGVRRAAATIQGDGATAALCGYYSGAVDQAALRRALSESLPYYMVPAFLMELPELPLNANGKLDRRALPHIPKASREYTAPRTEAEKRLCEAFAQALQTDVPVGIDDGFFELGGDSIRAMAVAALLREAGWELRVEWLFAAPTARALAPMLLPIKPKAEETRWSPQLIDAEWASIDRTVGRDNVEAVYPVLFHAKEYLRRGSLWLIPSVRLVDRCIPADELRDRLAELQRCRTALRSVFIGAGTERPLQVVLKDVRLSFFETDLRGLSDGSSPLSERQAAYLCTLIMLQRQAIVDAPREVPFRLGAIRVGEARTVIVCCYSHLLLDAAGIARVLGELLSVTPVISDAEAFESQIVRLCTADRSAALDYWKKVTGVEAAFTRLPPGSGYVPFAFDEAASAPGLLQRALAHCAERQVTLPALLHLAAGETLMELLELPEVRFASVTSGRDAASAQLAGMFISHFPVRIRRGDTPEAVQAQLLAGLRCGCLNAEELPPRLGLPGMDGAFVLNVENAGESVGENILPALMRGDRRFAGAMAADACPPAGIDGTLMVFLDRQIRLVFYYSPAAIDRAFVKSFGAALLARLRRMVE